MRIRSRSALLPVSLVAVIGAASSTVRADPTTVLYQAPPSSGNDSGTVIVNVQPAPVQAAEDVRPPASEPDRVPPPRPGERFLHGFRFGYGYVMNYQKPVPAFGGQSLADKTGMRTPNHFLLGYEGMYRLTGHSWLNVILVGNVILAGLEQSQFYPTANGLLGFEFNNSFQVGVGASLQPLEGSVAHAIMAAGWTPRVGSFYIPVHAFFIPDVDGVNRMGVTTGVTW